MIGELYQVEDHLKKEGLTGERKRAYRQEQAKPIVDRFFAWVNERFEAQGLLPSNPLTKALAYARDRRQALEVFLSDPDVPIDTNHLERILRVIPMGRRAWLFCWTELGAKQVGMIQSLLVTCRQHGVDPYATWSMCSSGSASTRRTVFTNSRLAAGRNVSPNVRSAPP
jgi:transposase